MTEIPGRSLHALLRMFDLLGWPDIASTVRFIGNDPCFSIRLDLTSVAWTCLKPSEYRTKGQGNRLTEGGSEYPAHKYACEALKG